MKKFKVSRDKDLKPIMQGYPLSANASVLDRYRKRLKRLTSRMRKDVEKQLFRAMSSEVYEEFDESQEELETEQRVAFDESITSKMRILLNRLKAKWAKKFKDVATDYADDMIEHSDITNRKAVNISFSLLSGGLSIKSAISNSGISEIKKSSKVENASLIESIYQGYFTNISGDVMRGISSGEITSAKELISKRGSITERRAGNIASDQVKKLYNNLNKQRMQSQGLNKFKWRHSSAGQFPRQDHIDMDGNIYSFDDLPVIDKRTGERGIPGQAINCRCFMVPIIEFDDEAEQ